MPRYEVQVTRTYTWDAMEAESEQHAEQQAIDSLDGLGADVFEVYDTFDEETMVNLLEDDDDSEPEPPKLHVVPDGAA